MNEKRQNEMIYRTASMESRHEMDLAGLLMMVSSLEMRAKRFCVQSRYCGFWKMFARILNAVA